jgi:hypothetical protein
LIDHGQIEADRRRAVGLAAEGSTDARSPADRQALTSTVLNVMTFAAQPLGMVRRHGQ